MNSASFSFSLFNTWSYVLDKYVLSQVHVFTLSVVGRVETAHATNDSNIYEESQDTTVSEAVCGQGRHVKYHVLCYSHDHWKSENKKGCFKGQSLGKCRKVELTLW